MRKLSPRDSEELAQIGTLGLTLSPCKRQGRTTGHAEKCGPSSLHPPSPSTAVLPHPTLYSRPGMSPGQTLNPDQGKGILYPKRETHSWEKNPVT